MRAHRRRWVFIYIGGHPVQSCTLARKYVRRRRCAVAVEWEVVAVEVTSDAPTPIAVRGCARGAHDECLR